MAVLLRGLKAAAKSSPVDLSRITAIITMFDDGGSSGKIVEEYGILPPGDIRNCLVALSDEDQLLSRLFSHRFEGNGSLGGHSVGNLLLTALTHMNNGDFRKAVYEAGKVLAVKGTILPSTLHSATLCARLTDGRVISGESDIRKRSCGTEIDSLFLAPKREGESTVKALDECLQAIKKAHMIVIGPGSLYSSLLPNLLVEGVSEAISQSTAIKVYVCNIMTEAGETDGFGVKAHLAELVRLGRVVPDWVLVNTEKLHEKALAAYEREGAVQVLPGESDLPQIPGCRIMGRSLVGEVEIEEIEGKKKVSFHDAGKLGGAILELAHSSTGYSRNITNGRRNDVASGAH